MIFSKSFGYSVRGVLYIALMQKHKRFIQVEEIAKELNIPRHFMGKILKKLVKEGMLHSSKGPSGGFALQHTTLKLPLGRLIDITEGMEGLKTCVLRMKECNSANPCPLHHQMEGIKAQMKTMLSHTTIGDLLKEDNKDFLKSISNLADPILEKEI